MHSWCGQGRHFFFLIFWILSSQYLVRSTNCEAPHWATFPSIPVLLVSCTYIFSTKPSSETLLTYSTRNDQIFQKCRSHLKILGASRMTRSKFHTEDPQILGVTVENLVTRATWCTELVYSCTTNLSRNVRNKVSRPHNTRLSDQNLHRSTENGQQILNSMVVSIL
jgi:hypothetical protein